MHERVGTGASDSVLNTLPEHKDVRLHCYVALICTALGIAVSAGAICFINVVGALSNYHSIVPWGSRWFS